MTDYIAGITGAQNQGPIDAQAQQGQARQGPTIKFPKPTGNPHVDAVQNLVHSGIQAIQQNKDISSMQQPNTGDPKATAVKAIPGTNATPQTGTPGTGMENPSNVGIPPAFKDVTPSSVQATSAAKNSPDNTGSGSGQPITMDPNTGIENPENTPAPATPIDYNGLSSQAGGDQNPGPTPAPTPTAPLPDKTSPWDTVLGIAKTLGKSVGEIMANTGLLALGQPSFTQQRLTRENERYMQNQQLKLTAGLAKLQADTQKKINDNNNKLMADINALQLEYKGKFDSEDFKIKLQDLLLKKQQLDAGISTEFYNTYSQYSKGGEPQM